MIFGHELAHGEAELTYVCLELVHIHIESSVKSERRSQRGDDLGNEPVQVLLRLPTSIE